MNNRNKKLISVAMNVFQSLRCIIIITQKKQNTLK